MTTVASMDEIMGPGSRSLRSLGRDDDVRAAFRE
jgi:hypothetical protein